MSDPLLPSGFRFSGVASGIKASGKPDVSLIVSDRPLIAAGVYTQNQIVAAPVLLCRQRTPSSSIRAVVTNSGNANACTGEQGSKDAAAMCHQVAAAIGAGDEQVLVMSTGIIGQHLPMDRVRSGIDQAIVNLDDSSDHFHASADAILTTDQSRKVASCELQLDGQTVRIVAMAKGAGMIAPNMATMLAVVMTDAAIDQDRASTLLKHAADLSFNRVSVDGHSSTNDTLLLLASGESEANVTDDNEAKFAEALNHLCIALSKQLVADGEGATHIMKIAVTGALSDADAEVIARIVGESPLVKTAITGSDPNWGRIVSAAGYAGPKIEPAKTSLRLCGTLIYHDGAPAEFDAAALSKTMSESAEIEVNLIVGEGSGSSTRWASDLTVDYVRFNSEYTT